MTFTHIILKTKQSCWVMQQINLDHVLLFFVLLKKLQFLTISFFSSEM